MPSTYIRGRRSSRSPAPASRYNHSPPPLPLPTPRFEQPNAPPPIGTDDATSSDDDESELRVADVAGEQAAPEFPQLMRQIDAAITKLGGAVFPKLDWSAPRVRLRSVSLETYLPRPTLCYDRCPSHKHSQLHADHCATPSRVFAAGANNLPWMSERTRLLPHALFFFQIPGGISCYR